jgi:hypothetical protein
MHGDLIGMVLADNLAVLQKKRCYIRFVTWLKLKKTELI